jgi:uncharacterized protein
MSTRRLLSEIISNDKVALDNEIIRSIDGSSLYGTSVSDASDRDEVGVFVEPIDLVLGFRSMDQYRHRTQPEGVRSGEGDVDLNIYSLRKFMSLAMNGNPSIMMLLFAPEQSLIKITPIGSELQSLAPKIVSKKAAPRFLGYLQSQMNKLIRQTGEVKARPELIERYGFDTKYAGHAARLALQGIELMDTGRLSLPMEDESRGLVVDIRTGQFSFDETMKMLTSLEDALKAAMDRSTLNDLPDYSHIEQWMISAHERTWYAD